MARRPPSIDQSIEGVLGSKLCAGVALIAAAASALVAATVDGDIAAWAIGLPAEVRRSALFDGMRAIGAFAAFWLVCVLAWARRRPRVLLVALLALVLCGAGVAASKLAFGRGRPDRDSELRPIPSRAVEDFDDLSFPSGDTAQAFALAFVAASYLPRRWRWTAFALAGLPALQRVVAARHFFGDVLGGIALGALCAWLAGATLDRARRTMSWRWRWPVRRELALIAGAGWCGLWTFEEGRIFAQYGAPVVALVVLAVKGPAFSRWARRQGGARAMKRTSLRCAVLLGCFALLYLPAQSRFGLVDYDEGAYAQIANEMLERGNYVAPELNGEPFFEKPPLLYWTQILGYRAFGTSPAGARIGNGLAALALLAVLYVAARRPLGSRAALATVAILGTSALFVGLAWIALTDMLLALCFAISIACLHEAFERDRAQRAGGTSWFLAGAVAASMAVLAKGLIGLALPAATALAFLCSVRQIGSALRWTRLLGGAAIATLLGGSWYLFSGLTHAGGFEFLRELLYEHHLRRAAEPMQGHGGPFLYYLPVLALGLLPWSPLLLPALARRDAFDAGTERGRFLRLFALGAGFTFLLFSIAATKLPNYALPILPFAALVLGDLHARCGTAPSRGTRAALVAAQLLCAVLAAFALAMPALLLHLPDWIGKAAEKEPGLRRTLDLGSSPFVAAAICVAAAAASFHCVRRARYERACAALAAGAFALYLFVSWSFVPRFDEHFLAPLRAAARAAAQHVVPGERLVLVGIRQRPSIVFESGLCTELVAPRQHERLTALFGPRSTRIGLVTEDGRAALAETLPGFRVISEHSGWVLFRGAD